jgi:LysR family glycine cleavage system transcriptional activator
MTRRIPPFSAIRAFEAAARHLSFRRAAEDLHVTPSAISHQVKALEQYLGVALFRRKPQGVNLTDAGKTYLPLVGGALDRIASASERLKSDGLSGPLTVGMSSAFATRWMVPRLGHFRDTFPNIDLRLTTVVPPVDFARDDVDAGLRFGQGGWQDVIAHRFASSVLFPVCSPKLTFGETPLRTPEDLRHHSLIHFDHCEEWSNWLARAGVSGVDASRGPHFDDCNVFFQALIDGHGVGLSLSALAAPDLEAGRLVVPFDVNVMPTAWYYFVYPKASADRPKIIAFRDWLLDESLFAAGPAELARAS